MATTSTTSRYAPAPGVNATDSKQTTQGSGTSTENTSQNQQQNQQQTSTTTTNQTTQTLDSGTIALLNRLIASLSAQNNQDNAARNGQMDFLSNQEGQYSKGNAFADAQGLIQETLRRALESTLPGIRAAQESAGSSGSALQALLMQDAAQRASESASNVGVTAATNYGNVSANFAKVLQDLISSPTGSSQALLKALDTLKGAITTVNGTQTTNTEGTTNTSTTGTGTRNTTSNENKNTDFAPFNVVSNTPTSSTSPIYFGPASPDPINLSRDLLSAMSTTRAFDELFIN